jgi:hypothetical protein
VSQRHVSWSHGLDIFQDRFYRRILADAERLQWLAREEMFAESTADPGAKHHEAVQGLLQRFGGM